MRLSDFVKGICDGPWLWFYIIYILIGPGQPAYQDPLDDAVVQTTHIDLRVVARSAANHTRWAYPVGLIVNIL